MEKSQTEDYFKFQTSCFYEKIYSIKQIVLPTA